MAVAQHIHYLPQTTFSDADFASTSPPPSPFARSLLGMVGHKHPASAVLLPELPYVWELRLVAPMEDCVVDVIQKLPRLRVLRLYNLRTDPEPHITLRVGSPRSLDRLEFSNSACDAVDGILAISSLFSYIGSLGLHGVNFIENDTSRPSLCLGFEALELNACVGIKEFQCLFRPALTPPATRLTTLALIGVSWYVRTDRAKFWRVVAPALVNLMLDPKSMRSPRSPDFLSVLDLSQCTLLTTLTLTFSQDVIPDSDHSEWVRATRILSRLVGHPSVRRVIIQITVCIPIKGYIAYEGQNRSIEDALLELRDRQLEVAIVDGGSDDDCVEPGYLAALFPRVFASA
ncbi:hypothetical protein NM688_g2793 [Phlebia brevispora]|uniref:Uncharacterized protein n=1 Tax=Phlebia brevispora TaxID=194682 RepID=A0ACC1T7I0_9APHY|nr:hypothetical protein NM688_g2793 [Phlebia brevispora]